MRTVLHPNAHCVSITALVAGEVAVTAAAAGCTAPVMHNGPDRISGCAGSIQYSSAAVQQCCSTVRAVSQLRRQGQALWVTHSCLRVLTVYVYAITYHQWAGHPSAEPVQAVLTSTAVSTTLWSNALVRLHHAAGAL